MLEIIKDKENWNNILESKFKKYYDTYFLWEYYDLYEKNYSCFKELIFFQDENIEIFWPHLIRKISDIKWLEKYDNYYDCTTPYWYWWPIINKKNDKWEKSLDLFLEKYNNYCYNNNYVSEFIRFYPVFENYLFLNGKINKNYINNTIVLNINKNIDDIWKENISSKRRNQIRRENKIIKKFEIEKKPSEKSIKDFLKIYYDTMDKNEAEKKYYFSYKFIENTFDIWKTIFIKSIDNKNNILSQSIFFGHWDTLHYHLSASNYNIWYWTSSSLLWEAIKYWNKKGYKYFMFGWWTSSDENNPLFKFKKSFGWTKEKFYIGKIIFNENIYNLLKMNLNMKWTFFPIYRLNFNKLI